MSASKDAQAAGSKQEQWQPGPERGMRKRERDREVQDVGGCKNERTRGSSRGKGRVRCQSNIKEESKGN